VFCNKACFDKWLRWKTALLSGTERPTCSKQEDRQLAELREEDKPGCFGAIGKTGKRKDPECPCAWKDRCKQSQEDY